MTNPTDNLEEIPEEKKPEVIQEAYRKRLSVLKKAQEYSRDGDHAKSVQQYNLYLNALARFFGVKEESLSPKYFDAKKDITELLLISHAYWDLAKAYDRSPKLQYESIRCLKQFVKFSAGFKFQHVNAQMLRKFIRKGQVYNPRAFKDAYELIHTKSKGCYIVSFCFESESPLTTEARCFRDKIANFSIGKFFINQYYRFSPGIVSRANKNFLFRTILALTIRPLLFLFLNALKIYANIKKTNSY